MRHIPSPTRVLLLGTAAAALTLAPMAPALAETAGSAPAGAMMAPRPGAPASFADLVERLQPAVVSIVTRQKIKTAATKDPFAGTPFEGLMAPPGGSAPQERSSGARGSGFLVSADGYVVTNNHVITMDNQGLADKITVVLSDNTEYKARIVGRDQQSDVAVLKIDAPKPLPFVQFGDSTRSRTGDWVLVIGNPLGLQESVTAGIISSVHRSTGIGAYDKYIQTDASINQGNSGGPMFDMSGRVIGINNWIIASGGGGNIGIGFAIPADVASPIVERLKKGETIERGYLGIRIQPLTDEMADSLGLPHNHGEFVQSVEPGNAGAKAGMQPGDIVLKVNHADVTPEQTLSYLVSNTAPGTAIPLELVRGGKRLTLTAIVGKRPSEDQLNREGLSPDQKDDSPDKAQGAANQVVEKALGFTVLALSPQVARQIGAADSVKGVVVNNLDASSDAAAKGLQPGDIVLSANYHPTTSAADLSREIKAAKAAGRPGMLLQVQRRGQPAVYVPVLLADGE